MNRVGRLGAKGFRMDEIGSLVVVIIIVVASLIGKIQEQRRAKERKLSRKPVRPEDLPEATRRMLYGAPDKPAAEARREAAPVRTAQPRVAPRLERPRPQPMRRPPQPQAPRQVLETATPPPPPPPVRRRPAPPPETQPETVSMQARHEQMMAQRMGQLRDAQAQHAAMLQRAQQIRQGGAAAAAQQPRARRKAAPSGAGLFSNLDEVRRGIVLMEVLGPPKAFE